MQYLEISLFYSVHLHSNHLYSSSATTFTSSHARLVFEIKSVRTNSKTSSQASMQPDGVNTEASSQTASSTHSSKSTLSRRKRIASKLKSIGKRPIPNPFSGISMQLTEDEKAMLAIEHPECSERWAYYASCYF
jgi:hypothetical protein